MPVVPFSKTGTAPKDAEWNWDAATQNSILGSDGDDWAAYKRAHAWWDGATGKDAQKKAPYKLPHHRASADGQLEAVWHGVTNAMARLSSADIPEDEMRGAFDHLAQHYAQFGEKAPDWDRFIADVRERRAMARRAAEPATRVADLVQGRSGQRGAHGAHGPHGRPGLGGPAAAGTATATAYGSNQVFSVRAAMGTLTTTVTKGSGIWDEARPGGRPTEQDLERINTLARSPLTADDVYVFPAEISSEEIDAYYTRMTPEALANYAADATRGVAICDSHGHERLPIGRSFYGEVVTVTRPDGTSMQAVRSLAYLVRGLPLSTGMNSNDLIRGIEAGIYSDVSIGFIPQHFWCSICGLDMLNDWDCPHIPGMQYEMKNTGLTLCVADVVARLAEYSLVYEGATPNAMLLKTERLLEAGLVDPKVVRLVESRFPALRILDQYPGYAQAWAEREARLAGAQDASRFVVGPGTATATTHQGEPLAGGRSPRAEEDDDMTGADFIAGVIERSGKELSTANLEKLRGIHSKMQSGHGTLTDAMEEMARFMADKDGTNPDPNSTPGASEPAGEGEDQHGVDTAHDHPPSMGANGAGSATTTRAVDGGQGSATEPGTDDGDGDDDKPTRETGDGASGDPQAVDKDSDTHGPVHTGDAKHAHGKYGMHSHADDANHDSAPLKADEQRDAGDDNAPADAAGGEGGDPNGEGGEDRGAGGAVVPRATRGTSETSAAGSTAAFTPAEVELLELGRAAREELLADIEREGARAMGLGWKPDLYRAILANAAVKQLRDLRDHLREAAKLNLGTRGTWVADSNHPEGGYWTGEPTGQGGRQTQAQDPNDPMGVIAAAAGRGGTVATVPGVPSNQSGSYGTQPQHRQGDDPSFYRTGYTAQRPRSR